MSQTVPQVEAKSAILAQRCVDEAKRYLDRRKFMTAPGLPAPDPGLGLVVVVPALGEPDIVATLHSVAAATGPDCAVELILVINSPDNAAADLRDASATSLREATDWAERNRHLKCHVFDCRDLPADHASVGLARKIGMDTALMRLAESDTGRGVIVSLDADCTVAENYLTAIEQYFHNTPAAVGATIYFEHPLDKAPAETRSAIVDYELHLRCYRHGLTAAGSPYASYTVGSAFAVRSEIYAQEGGMNRRSAGEDFYFINKLLKRGHVTEITDTTVFPSARLSARVPFGTGAAMRLARDKPVKTYAPAVYRELKTFQTALEASVLTDRRMPSGYASFLESMSFDTWLVKTRANVASTKSLTGQLTRWLDGFRTMKFIHWLTETGHPRVRPADAAREILGWKGQSPASTSQALLEQFRALDRSS